MENWPLLFVLVHAICTLVLQMLGNEPKVNLPELTA